MGRSNVVSVEPGKEDIRDEFPQRLQSCKSGQTRRSCFFFLSFFFYCLIERKHPTLEYFEIKDGGATVKAKARVRRGSVRR